MKHCILAAAALSGMAGTVFGQAAHERARVMPPAPPTAPRYSPPGAGAVDDFYSAQVNVGPNGQNILNDAANEPSIASDPTAPNRIAIGWRQFDSISSNFRQAGRAWSNDGGRTWHNPGPLDPGVFRSDPVLRADSSGRIYYYSLTNGTGNEYSCQMFRSDDGGQTFQPLVQALGGDKAWIAVDRTAGASSNFLYAAWDYATIYTPNGFSRSIDRGSTYQNAVAMPTQPNWGTLAVGPSGEVYVCGNLGGNLAQFTLIKSTNAANPAATPTFPLSRTVNMGGAMVYFTNNTPNPGGLLGQAWTQVDISSGPTRGNVYMLCSVDPPGADPLDVNIVRSTDGGATWSAPIKVNDEAAGANAWQWFAAIDVAPTGRIDVIWLDTKNTGQVNRSELRYSFSSNGGSTWAPSVPLGAQFDSTIGYPQQNKLGDYMDIQSDRVGANIAYAATFTGGQDVYFVRVNDWDCNSNGIPDTTDLAAGTLHDCNANGIPDECELAAGVPVNCPCYANCDGSTTAPVLNVNDFICFQQKYAAGDAYANCDGSTTAPVLNVNDFICFQQKFAAGCP